MGRLQLPVTQKPILCVLQYKEGLISTAKHLLLACMTALFLNCLRVAMERRLLKSVLHTAFVGFLLRGRCVITMIIYKNSDFFFSLGTPEVRSAKSIFKNSVIRSS
ncbi:hypothetical protein XENTR_v10012345 [Xenopus tropicalis]|nr:hypothetical protein XENTR_v10012345 [Xenopus tropicalis]